MISLVARLARLEAHRPPSEIRPWVALIVVCDDGTTVSLCYTDRPRVDMTLREYGSYRAALPPDVRLHERWTILGDAAPIADRMSAMLSVAGSRAGEEKRP